MAIVKLAISVLTALALMAQATFDYFGVQRDIFAGFAGDVMIQAKLPDTEYAKRAAQWMDTRQPLPAAQTACVGCHAVRQ